MDEKFPPEAYSLPPEALAEFDPARLLYLSAMTMPYGKYAGKRLIELPEAYLLWFKTQGFPEGELGRALREMLEIKANGLEFLFDPLG